MKLINYMRNTKLLVLISCVVLFTYSSQTYSDDSRSGAFQIFSFSKLENSDTASVNDIFKKLITQIPEKAKKKSTAVATIVSLDDLKPGELIGLQLQNKMIGSLKNAQFKVIDFKITGNIIVSKKGDIAYSRNWKDLKESFPIDQVVVGTISQHPKGLELTVSMIDIKSNEILGSVTDFLQPEDALDNRENLLLESWDMPVRKTFDAKNPKEPLIGSVQLYK